MSNGQANNFTITAEELLGTIRHSNLHNIVVEGPDDVRWYGILLEKSGIDLVPLSAGGRVTLLNVFSTMTPEERRSVVFVADRDMWYFSSVPSEYEDVVFTKGYSIENDVLKDSAGYGLLRPEEKSLVERYKTVLGDWFAFCVEQGQRGGSLELDVHPNKIAECSNGRVTWRAAYRSQIGYTKPSESLLQRVCQEFELGFRGKCLATLYAAVIALRDNRKDVKYSDAQLMDVSLRASPIDGLRKDIIDRIADKIR